MRNRLIAITVATVLSACAGTSFHPQTGEDTVADELIVRLAPGADIRSVIAAGLAAANGSAPGATIQLKQSLRHGNLHALKVPPGLRDKLGDLLAKVPGVEYSQANHILHTTLATPNDPALSSQWALQTVQALQGWGSI